VEKIIAMHEAHTPGGVSATIYEVEEYSDAGAATDPDVRRPSIKRFELADGRPLKMVGRREYMVEGTDEVFLVTDQRREVCGR